MSIIRRKMYIEHSFDLFEKKKMRDTFNDQRLLLFRVVAKKQSMENMHENSFMILTNSQLSVFNEDQHEVGRVTGLKISGGVVIDSRYLYVMQDTYSQLY